MTVSATQEARQAATAASAAVPPSSRISRPASAVAGCPAAIPALTPDTVGAVHVADRVFAALYDRVARKSEEAGLRERRRSLLSRARGRVLEVGAGTGLNIDHYPDDLDGLV